MNQLRKKSLQGVVWSFIQQFSGQILSFLISIVLARLLLPAEFGLIGMIAIIIAIGGALKDAGMSQSLIRTEKPEDIDYSTVFYINIIVSVLVYVIVFVSAPLVSRFYGEPQLVDLIRVLSIGIVLGAFSAVQKTKLTMLSGKHSKQELLLFVLQKLLYGVVILVFLKILTIIYGRLATNKDG